MAAANRRGLAMGPQPGAIFAEPAAYADPVAWHEQAARIRRGSPILRVELDEYPAFWAITKHADVMEIERNSEIFTNAPTPSMGLKSELRSQADPGVNTLVQMDGEEHRAHRAIVNDWFKPGQIKKLQGRAEELSKRFVDEMAAMGGECDFARDIAMQYPLHVILSILGLPETDYGRMLKLTQEMFGAEDPDIGRAGEDNSIFEVLMDFAAYFQALAADRRAHPTSDLASVIANATIDDAPLPDMDMVGFYLIIATAGHDTTSNSIGGGLLALVENSEQLTRLRETPELIDNAADEIIRWVSPVKQFTRTCRTPFTLRDVTFEPGDLLLLSYPSANRDDEVFADPFRFDVGRENASSHLAFGFGRHFCLGAHLARLEIRSFFRELVPRLDSVELAGTPTFVHARLVSGPKSVPIRYQLR
jgi:cytochrome P450